MKKLLHAAALAVALLVCAPAAAQHATTSAARAGYAPEQACLTWSGGTAGAGSLISCSFASAGSSVTHVVVGGSFITPANVSMTASATSGSASLLVSAVGAGKPEVGTIVTATNIPVGTTINLCPSGVCGGPGTYTLSVVTTGAVSGTVTGVTPYSVGDLVGTSFTASSIAPVSFAAVRSNGGTGTLTGVCISKTGTSVTNAAFRVHFYKGLATVDGNGHFVTSTGGDNAPIAINTRAAVERGYVDVVLDIPGTDGAKGCGAPARGPIIFDTNPATTNMYEIVEARGAYAPAGVETIVISNEIEQD